MTREDFEMEELLSECKKFDIKLLVLIKPSKLTQGIMKQVQFS